MDKKLYRLEKFLKLLSKKGEKKRYENFELSKYFSNYDHEVEILRNYIDHEKWKVVLVGSGRDKDYAHDGISHWSEDAKEVIGLFKNIESYFPEKKESVEGLLKDIVERNKPAFISLQR